MCSSWYNNWVNSTYLGYFILYSKPFLNTDDKKRLLVQIHVRTVYFIMLNYLSLSCIQCLYVQGNPFHTRILREVCGSGDLWSVRTRQGRAVHCGSYRGTSEIYCMDKIYTPLSCLLKVEHMADIWISEILCYEPRRRNYLLLYVQNAAEIANPFGK